MFERKRFSPEELQRIEAAVRRTWQTIGHDICEANGGNEPSKAAKAEVICDAGILSETLRKMGYKILGDKVFDATNIESVVRRML